MRLEPNGIWRNRPEKDLGPKHPKYAAKNCPDCDSGVYCRCPIWNQLVDRETGATSPYSRKGHPPTDSYIAFLEASKKAFAEGGMGPGSPMLGNAAELLEQAPDQVLRSPQMPPMLGDAVLSAGIAASRRHTTQPYMCSSPKPLMTTAAAIRPLIRARSAYDYREGERSPWYENYPPTPREENIHSGLKRPSPFRRCI